MVRAPLEAPVIRRVFVARFGESAQLFDEFGVRHLVLVLDRHPARATEDAAVDGDARQGTLLVGPIKVSLGLLPNPLLREGPAPTPRTFVEDSNFGCHRRISSNGAWAHARPHSGEVARHPP